MLEFKTLLTAERILLPLHAETKEQAIRRLVAVLAETDSVSDAEQAVQAVLLREHTRTTGIGHALAIPHAKLPNLKRPAMAVGLASEPIIDFDSVDGRPVSVVVLLLSPQGQTAQHIQALARISRLLCVDAFRKRLLKAQSPDEAYRLICEEESSQVR